MAFIGTPLDTRNTFQSLVGKRFDGDGSTTAFTLDVAPSSVLDIEVFVGNVRQDPNSAYTLSGTTLTFTGAPPSGTNNIYVVHQAKSVGTIGIPDDTISARTLVTLDNSADHVLIEDATDGELKKALIPAASFAGIDDQTSSNDDQLTITDTAVVINEDSDDVDFRVESNGNANAFVVDGGNDTVLLGNSTVQTIGGDVIKQQISGTGSASANLSISRHSANNGSPNLTFYKSRNAALGSFTIVADNDVIGKINFQADDGTDAVSLGASIFARVNGTPGANDMPTELVFGTSPDGSQDITERLSITEDGRGLSQFTAKVWANYSTHPISLKDSHNISSVTDNAGGDTTFTFSNAMANANYSVVSTSANGTSHGDFQGVDFVVEATGNVRIGTCFVSATNSGASAHDVTDLHIVIFGD
jgi:hypothetical protein